MKISNTGEANINLERSRSLKIEFIRFGKKGNAKSKELFWLSRTGGFTINDLKTIAIEAEELLKIINE